MIKNLTISQIFVTDQDVALDVHVGTLGLELSADVDFGLRGPFGNHVRISQMHEAPETGETQRASAARAP